MTFSNPRFHFDNLFDAIDAADITVASAVATLPAWHLQHQHRTRVWRSTGLTAQYIKWDLGAADAATYIGLVNHNLTVDGEITLTASDNSDMSAPVYTETWDAWDPVVGYGEGGYGEFGYGGYLREDQRAELGAGAIFLKYFGQTVSARYWRIDFIDAANADGYIEAGRVYHGLYWEPLSHMRFPLKFTPVDASKLAFSEGGQIWEDLHEKRYTIEFTLGRVRDEEKYWNAVDMLRRFGKRKDMLLRAMPDGAPSELFFLTIYGRLHEIPALSMDSHLKNSVAIQFIESL